MSTLLKAGSFAKRIRTIEDVRGYFQSFSKPKSSQKIGIECEFFGVNSDTGEAIPYSGASGVEVILKELAYEFGHETILEGEHIVALRKNGTVISLEPGGQIELSASPVASIHEAKAQLDEFIFQLRTVAQFVGKVSFLAVGIHPFSKLEKIEWVPKRRYSIMRQYLGQKGSRAHDMMKRTCANQINLDYENEEDAIEKMRLAFRITPIAAAMFAHSGFAEGKPTGFLDERINIWRFTDPERSGLAFNLACEHCSFQDYLNYVLDVPMMFIVRDNEWIVTPNLTFRKFVEKGYQGIAATLNDFELHLSTIFTDVRFKQYLEIRGIDGQRVHLIPAVCAFWKGILYDAEARKAAKSLLKPFKEKSLIQLYRDVERSGLRAKVGHVKALEMAKELVKLSEKGLERARLLNEAGEDERIYLMPLKEEILDKARTPAEELIELWKGPMRQSRKAVIDYLRI
jgi:glutamate--cysteine ligase